MQALSNVMGDQGRCVKMMYQFTNGPWGRFFPPWSRFAPITGRNQVRIRRGGGGPPDGEVGYRPPCRHRVRDHFTEQDMEVLRRQAGRDPLDHALFTFLLHTSWAPLRARWGPFLAVVVVRPAASVSRTFSRTVRQRCAAWVPSSKRRGSGVSSTWIPCSPRPSRGPWSTTGAVRTCSPLPRGSVGGRTATTTSGCGVCAIGATYTGTTCMCMHFGASLDGPGRRAGLLFFGSL